MKNLYKFMPIAALALLLAIRVDSQNTNYTAGRTYQGAAQTTGNVVVGSGWGSVTGQTVAGNTEDEQTGFTTPGSGQGASPTIVITFASPYPSGSVPVCFAVQNGGNGANFVLQSGTATATGVTFTGVGTPVNTKTYQYAFHCGVH